MDELGPGKLTWAEVDPRAHAFRSDGLEALVLPLVPVKNTKQARADPEWETAITRALVQRHGKWICGWRWAADEGSIGGGPVHAWCCAHHSLSTPVETAARVKAAAVEWRGWLERLSARFEQLSPTEATREAIAHAFERSVASLVTDVVEQTHAGDAWYNHCAQVLGWYLERMGVGSEHARKLVDDAIGGRFESWIAPDESVIRDVAGRVARDASTA